MHSVLENIKSVIKATGAQTRAKLIDPIFSCLALGKNFLMKHIRIIFGGIVVFLFLSCWLIILPLYFILPGLEDPASDRLVFWLQTAAGNWPLSDPKDWVEKRHLSYAEIAFSAGIAIALNNLMVIALAGAIWKVITEKRNVMNLKKAIETLEITTKFALMKEFSFDDDAQRKIEAAFENGHKATLTHLKKVMGDADAKEFMANISPQ